MLKLTSILAWLLINFLCFSVQVSCSLTKGHLAIVEVLSKLTSGTSFELLLQSIPRALHTGNRFRCYEAEIEESEKVGSEVCD